MWKLAFHLRSIGALVIKAALLLLFALIACMVFGAGLLIGIPIVVIIGLAFLLSVLGARVDPRWRKPF